MLIDGLRLVKKKKDAKRDRNRSWIFWDCSAKSCCYCDYAYVVQK